MNHNKIQIWNTWQIWSSSWHFLLNIFRKPFGWDHPMRKSSSFCSSLLWGRNTMTSHLTSSRVFSWLCGIWIADCSLLSSLSSSGSEPRRPRGCWCRSAPCCRGSSGARGPPQTRGSCSGSISHLSHRPCDTLGGWGWRPGSWLPGLHTSRASDGRVVGMKRGGPRITEVGWRKRDTFLWSLVVSWYQGNCKAVG